MHSVKSSVAGNADNVAHRYAIFLCSLDVEIAIGQYKDSYLIFVIFFTLAKFLENKIYTEKRQFFALNL